VAIRVMAASSDARRGAGGGAGGGGAGGGTRWAARGWTQEEGFEGDSLGAALSAATQRGDFLDIVKGVVWGEECDERAIVRKALAAMAVGGHRSLSTMAAQLEPSVLDPQQGYALLQV
jgi:hypothetical protein